MIPASLQSYTQQLQPRLDKVKAFLESRLKADLSDIPPDVIIARTKRPESIFEKLQTGKYSSVQGLKDLVGVTVVVLYRHQIRDAMDAVMNSGLVIVNQPNATVLPTDFKYREPKIYVALPQDYQDRNPDIADLIAEVQFTTTLQHALDVTTHDFDYKGRSYSWSNLRLVAQLRGMLEMVDVMIDDIDSVSLNRTEVIGIPEGMVYGAAVLSQMVERFDDSVLPNDRRRLADTVGAWVRAAGLAAEQLGELLDRHADLLSARSIDPASAALGALLREHADALLENHEGSFCVSSELESLCREASRIPEDRRVDIGG